IHPEFLIYPAHIWTPWFAVFGSKSGFNSMEECFHDQTEHIYAYETGLSSDPPMNWRISALDDLTTLSNSDAHSLPNIGREANVMDLQEPGYKEIREVIKNKDLTKFLETIEFYPEEGMYHYDGHRNCGVSYKPQETHKHKNICPVCKKPLTVGVMNRVEELADREEGFVPEEHTPFRKLVELDKIIAESLGIKSRNSRKVQGVYEELIDQAGSELHILMEADLDRLKEYADPVIVEGVSRVRKGDLMVRPGFDGQYGEVSIFKPEEKKDKQPSLF
ncbi:MAG TPA: endonuclease Q family protein, partial [Patescibacteria group bacterium]|nr:endonuclease Q family protein [Patescibacteria group bacterium]